MERFVGKDYGVIGDKMFTFNKKEDEKKIIGITPTKKNRGQEHLPPDLTLRKYQISSIRVEIEHYFARLKGWRVFKDTFRHFSLLKSNNIEFDDVILCVANLVQWSLSNA